MREKKDGREMREKRRIRSYRELRVYQVAMDAAIRMSLFSLHRKEGGERI